MTTLYTILFFATFPALWLLAAFLDRVWPIQPEHPTRRAPVPKDR